MATVEAVEQLQPASLAEAPPAVRRFLQGIETANWDGMEAYLTPGVVYDASVPGWHYLYQGPEHVLAELRDEWTGKHPWRIIEIHTTSTPDGCVVDLEMRGQRSAGPGQPTREVGCRLANIFRLEGGRIAEHRLYCCGEWDEDTLRQIEAEAPKLGKDETDERRH